jgi:hypothetical protein
MDMIVYEGLAIFILVLAIPITWRLLEIYFKTKFLSPEEAKKKMEGRGFHYLEEKK